MSGFDADIGSLLDDVLNDVTPTPETPEVPEVVVQAVIEATPEALEAIEEQTVAVITPPPTGNTSLADLLADEPTDVTSLVTPPDENLVTMTEPDGTETIVDGGDLETAGLPEVDNSMFSEEVEVERIPLPEFTNGDIMEAIDIRNYGTLASLSTQRWHAKVRDRKAAKDAAVASGADGESFEARKRLLVGADEKLRRVHKAIDAARTQHYAMTLPWSTVGVNDQGKRAGARLLPNTLFFDYTMMMGKHKAEMTDALDEFVAAYPTLIAISQQKLGTAFNQNEYPAPASIEKHFDLSFDFDPIPEGSDFAGLQDDMVEKLGDALKRKTQQKLENAMQDAWTRLFDDVSHAAATLSNPNLMFHFTLIEKLRGHTSMLKHLNITGDPTIETIRKDIETKLCMHDVKDVRKDDALRKLLGEHAMEIVEQMKEFANVNSTS